MALKAMWEKYWSAKLREKNAEIQALQEDFERKLCQVALEKDHLITQITSEKKFLEAKSQSVRPS